MRLRPPHQIPSVASPHQIPSSSMATLPSPVLRAATLPSPVSPPSTRSWQQKCGVGCGVHQLRARWSQSSCSLGGYKLRSFMGKRGIRFGSCKRGRVCLVVALRYLGTYGRKTTLTSPSVHAAASSSPTPGRSTRSTSPTTPSAWSSTWRYVRSGLWPAKGEYPLGSEGSKDDKSLEIETWYDLALLYLGMSQWRDAEVCISKMRAICAYSTLAWHATGKLYEAKGLPKEALGAYSRALDLDPKHVPSLISTAIVLRQLGNRPLPSVRCFLTDALQLDRTNHVAWFNPGLLYKEEGGRSAAEAAKCFQAAALLEETTPVEPFR